MDKKKVIKIKGDKIEIKEAECNRLKMEPASRFIEKIWYDCILQNFEQEKKPSLMASHCLILDDRIKTGYELFKNGHIKECIITETDVRAIIESEDKKSSYSVVIKGWCCPTGYPPRLKEEISSYLKNLTWNCSCPDFQLNGIYRNNCLLLDKHTVAVFFLLQNKELPAGFMNMPKFLISPIEAKEGYKKSKSEDIVNVKGYPMKRFSPSLTILNLNNFKGINTSTAFSIHRIPNEEYKSEYPTGINPVWISFIDPNDILKLIKGTITGYQNMLKDRGYTEAQIKEAINNLIPTKNGEIKEEIKEDKINMEEPSRQVSRMKFLEKKGEEETREEKLKKEGWFKRLINKIKGWFTINKW